MYTSAKPYFYGTGRRKKSVARVRLYPGTGAITINGRDIDTYFGLDTLKLIVNQPFGVTETVGKFDIVANVKGILVILTPLSGVSKSGFVTFSILAISSFIG